VTGRIPDLTGSKLQQYIEKRRTAAWKQFMLPLPAPNSQAQSMDE